MSFKNVWFWPIAIKTPDNSKEETFPIEFLIFMPVTKSSPTTSSKFEFKMRFIFPSSTFLKSLSCKIFSALNLSLR